MVVLCKYYYAVCIHFFFILFRFHRFLVFLLPVLQYILFLFVTWLMLSRGVDVGFPSGIVISLVFFIIFSILNFYFHQFRVFLHSFFESFRITAYFNMYFELLYETSPDHVTVTSHSKWRLTMRNNHSLSEYSIFTLSFPLILSVLFCLQSNIVYCIIIKF